MRRALSNLKRSVARIEAVAVDMAATPLSAPADVRARQETLRCASVVILSGFFESFIKDCAEAYVRELCRRNVQFSLLPSRMQKKHFETGGQLLGQKATNKSRVAWIAATKEDMVVRLSSPATSPVGYTLLWEAFATTGGNPGPGVLKDVLEDLGVEKVTTKLNLVLGGTYETVRLALQSFIDVRNECAHTGSSTTIPTPGDLSDYCALLLQVAEAMVDVLEHRLGDAPFGVNLNTSDEPTIRSLPFVGRKAANLVTYRSANGPFGSFADIKIVPGFGEKSVRRLRLYAHVD